MANTLDQLIQNEISKLKCKYCEKVLSVPPIMGLSSDGTIFKCGRCVAFPGVGEIRNHAYEAIAKFVSFPCVYEGCNEIIPWAEVTKHEEICIEKSVICPIDSERCKFVKVRYLQEHCLEEHPNNIFFDSLTCEIDEFVPFVLIIEKHIFFVMIGSQELSRTYNRFQRDYDEIPPHFFSYVASLNISNKNFTYSMKLSSYETHDTYLCFDKLKLAKYVECSISHHPYSITRNKVSYLDEWYKKINLSGYPFEGRTKTKVTLEVVPKEEIDKPVILDKDLVDVVATSQANHLRSSLQCPVCMEYMIASIFNCAKGHVLCDKCRAKMESCPTCRTNFDNSRSFPLENLADVLVLNCTYSPRGCNFSGNVKKLFGHERDCDYKGK